MKELCRQEINMASNAVLSIAKKDDNVI
jgi:hypothetical protein